MAKKNYDFQDMFNDFETVEPEKTVPVKTESPAVTDNKVTLQQDNKVTLQQNNFITKPKKATAKKKSGSQNKNIHCRISEELKTAISIYCVKNNIKEGELIAMVIDNIIEEKNIKSFDIVYDTDKKGKDKSKLICRSVSDDVKIALVMFAKGNGYNEGYLIAQALARAIGWKKIVK
jgi:hypothetical protein